MDCSTGEGDKNRDKKIMMVKLLIQKKQTNENNRYRNNKKFSLLVKSSGIIP
jgi:hypothetical protein